MAALAPRPVRREEGAMSSSSPPPAVPPSLLRLERFLPYRLSIASNRVSDLVAEAYSRLFALSIPQWRVIAVLGEGTPLTQLAIVGQTVMDKMTVSRAVRALVARGVIDRAPHADDKRSQLLALSNAGRMLYASVAPAALAMEAALLDGFSSEEVATLEAALAKLEAATVRLSRKTKASA
jgi:DNA-binding MarR family transcriptional regulator